jgi:hypothetical protein
VPHETDILTAEIPGVDLAEDYLEAIQPDAGPTQLQLSYAALTNANLRALVPDSKIAVVDSADLHPLMVSDSEDKVDKDDAASDNDSDMESNVVMDEGKDGLINMLEGEDDDKADDASSIEGADKESICSDSDSNSHPETVINMLADDASSIEGEDKESICSDLDSNSHPDTGPIGDVQRSERKKIQLIYIHRWSRIAKTRRTRMMQHPTMTVTWNPTW